jgi:excisionase family DNA binding protein
MARMNRRPIVTSLHGLDDEFVLTTHDIASVMSCSLDKAGEMLATGQIPGMFRFGSRYHIYVGDFKKYLESQKIRRHHSPLDDIPEARGRGRRRSNP